MRASPWMIVGLLLCTSSATAGDWTNVGRATAQRCSARHQPAVTYDAAQSIEHYNQQTKTRDTSAFILVAAELPREQLSLHKIVDRPARFSTGEQVFAGRVSAAFLSHSDSQTVIVHVIVENRREAGNWLLEPAESGVLSLQQ